jgi:hypothetical protein
MFIEIGSSGVREVLDRLSGCTGGQMDKSGTERAEDYHFFVAKGMKISVRDRFFFFCT